MSLSTRIAPHLPFLRRFARACTGSQKSGDAYVAATLEALIEDISMFPDIDDDRIALYNLFCSTFGSLSVELDPTPSPFSWERHAADNITAIPARPRQAYLLVALEGFSHEDAARILDVDEGELIDLLARATEESPHRATDIMIIEDEPLIAMDIREIVTALGHTVTGVARTHKEALDLYRETKPKMILADIQLADGSSGIDAVNDILKDESMPVIFITAFPERLLTGERPEPTFLVTKPFEPAMVKALISQALFFNQRAETTA